MPNLLTDIEFDGLEFLSLVDAGASGDANHRPAVTLIKRKKPASGGDTDAQVKIPIVKLDQAQRVIYGLGSVITGKDGRPIVDYDGDVILAEDLEKAVHAASAMGGSGKGGDMHAFQGACDLVESAVITAEKRAAFGGFLGNSQEEGWLVGLKVHDDATWKAVADGKRPELSVKIRARRTPIADAEQLKLDLSRKTQEKQMPELPAENTPADPGADAVKASFDETLASLTEAQQKVILAMLDTARKEPVDSPDPAEETTDAETPEVDPMADAEKRHTPAALEEIRKEREEKEALAKRVKALEDREELGLCIEKARTEMAHIPGSFAEIGGMLQEAKSSMSKAGYDALTERLRATSKAISTGELFKEHGSEGDEGDDADAATLKDAVAKIRKDDPELSATAAKVIAFQRDPALYEKIRRNQ